LAVHPIMATGFDTSSGDALLRKANLRITKPRQVNIRVLVEAHDHPDAEQILARVAAEHGYEIGAHRLDLYCRTAK